MPDANKPALPEKHGLSHIENEIVLTAIRVWNIAEKDAREFVAYIASKIEPAANPTVGAPAGATSSPSAPSTGASADSNADPASSTSENPTLTAPSSSSAGQTASTNLAAGATNDSVETGASAAALTASSTATE